MEENAAQKKGGGGSEEQPYWEIQRVSLKCYVEQSLGSGEERVLWLRRQPGLEGAALRPGSALHSPLGSEYLLLCYSCFHYINQQLI